MKYLFDTNIVSELYDPKSDLGKRIRDKIKRDIKAHDERFISILTIYELEYGYAQAKVQNQPVLRKKIENIASGFEILSLSQREAQLFGELKKGIKDFRNINQENIKKHNIDVIIACTAIEREMTLVSADAIYDDLTKVNDKLQYEDWTV